MVTYPIHVRGNSYRGTDQKKRATASEDNRIAHELTEAINGMLLKQTEPIKVYLWGAISMATGYPYDTVAKFGMSIDGGSGGFTAWRHDLTYEQAIASLKP